MSLGITKKYFAVISKDNKVLGFGEGVLQALEDAKKWGIATPAQLVRITRASYQALRAGLPQPVVVIED